MKPTEYDNIDIIGITHETYKDKPEKTPPHADAQDCLQYGALHFTLNDTKSPVDTSGFSESNLSTGWN